MNHRDATHHLQTTDMYPRKKWHLLVVMVLFVSLAYKVDVEVDLAIVLCYYISQTSQGIRRAPAETLRGVLIRNWNCRAGV